MHAFSHFQCDFVDGVLVCCGGKVRVRKVSSTQVALNGMFCEEYFKIRELLYSQFSIVI
jgi:hypothetical protein